MMNTTRLSKRIIWTALAAVLASLAYSLLAVRGTFAPRQSSSEAHARAVVVGAVGRRITGHTFLTGTPQLAAPLVVLLHGDAPFVNPGYQYGVASDIANAPPAHES